MKGLWAEKNRKEADVDELIDRNLNELWPGI